MKKASLPDGALAQGVRPEVDLVSSVVEPEEFVTMSFEFEIIEARGIGSQKLEHLALVDQRPQIDDPGEPILPDDLENTEYHRFNAGHDDDLSH
jgi:hypothetical protein